MTVSPDQPDLLRAHAHLLAKLGDAGAERDVRRLEALGVETAADRSLLSGLRARAGSRSEALEAIELALAENPSRSDDWCSYAQLLFADDELVLYPVKSRQYLAAGQSEDGGNKVGIHCAKIYF